MNRTEDLDVETCEEVIHCIADPGAATTTSKTTGGPKIKNIGSGSKQSRVIALLSSPDGTTISAMMKATGWQQHSVRGFLAGVVRRKLKLKLNSKKIDGTRLYRIDSSGTGTTSKQSKRRVAQPT